MDTDYYQSQNQNTTQYQGYGKLVSACFQFNLFVAQLKLVHLVDGSELVDLLGKAFVVGGINQIYRLVVQLGRFLFLACLQQQFGLHLQCRQVIIARL